MTYLIDAGVLIALLIEDHSHNEIANAWFSRIASFATCPLTELAFIRIASHPTGPCALPAEAAREVLKHFTSRRGHVFWPDSLPVLDGPAAPTSKLTTDAYLAGLAMKRKGRLATFDRAIAGIPGVRASVVECLAAAL
jgi:toxin-antitoxin system PIN domain toxin